MFSRCFSSEGIKNALFQVPSSAQFQFPPVLEAEFRLDPEFRQRVVGLERMLRVREFLQATRACAVVHDSHDVVSGKTAGAELSVVSCAARRFLLGDSRLSRSCQRALPDGVGGGHVASGIKGAGAAFLGAMSETGAACETDRSIAVSVFRPSFREVCSRSSACETDRLSSVSELRPSAVPEALFPVEVSSFMRLQVRVQESLVHLCDMSLAHLS